MDLAWLLVFRLASLHDLPVLCAHHKRRLLVYRCPELSVTSQGKDVESARANLSEAIELYIETWGVPEARPAEGESFWTTVEISD